MVEVIEKTEQHKPKKVIGGLVAASLASVLAVGGVMAYLTDTASLTNNLNLDTNLKVGITEPNWVEANAAKMAPTQTVAKDPTITNTGTVTEYVAAQVKVPVFTGKMLNAENKVASVTDQDLFTYSLNTGWSQVGTPSVEEVDGVKYRVYTYVYANTLAATASSTAIFDDVQNDLKQMHPPRLP